MKEHGMTGKANARQGKDSKTSRIQLRIEPKMKAFWIKMAGGSKLSDYIMSRMPVEVEGEENGN